VTHSDEGKPCPDCGDAMTVAHDNYLPTWSDHHDNIVCWWCAKHPRSGAAAPQRP
jgi:hypothetical protein